MTFNNSMKKQISFFLIVSLFYAPNGSLGHCKYAASRKEIFIFCILTGPIMSDETQEGFSKCMRSG